jgi:ATP-binding cassette subfamily B protein
MIKFFVKILKFSGKYKGRVLSAAAFAFVKGICIQMPIFLAFLMFNDFYEGIMTTQKCAFYGIGLLASVIVHILATLFSDMLQSTAGYKLFADKRMELGSLLRKLPMGYFTSGNIGKISSVLGSDMVFVEENVMQSIADMLGHAFTTLLTVVFMYIINPYVGLLVSGVSLAVVVISVFMNKSGVKHSNIRQQQNEELTQSVITHIEGIGVIKSYNMLGEKSADLTDNFKKTRDAALKFEYSQLPWMFTLNTIYAVGMAGELALALYLFTSGGMTLPYLIGCVLYCFSIFVPIKALYGDAARLTVMNSCLDRVEELFAEKPLPDSGQNAIPEASDASEISFENVTFSYGGEATIKNVSFTAEKNTMTALVGPSGGGKTTLANLLARFWDIKSGSIKIRGVDIKSLPLSELMNQISMVFQRVYLFQDTVFNNIAMGKPDATRQEVENAAKKARCYDFIMQLPNGFDTVIGEGGASLSGGEKQRVSIARCILKDAPIVILDEATASVDLDNERYIQEAISELVKGKTLLVIAHRLNTIRSADKIVVVSGGEIAEQGTHDQLMLQNGTYRRFVSLRERNAV